MKVNEQRFVRHVLDEARRSNVTVSLVPLPHLTGIVPCVGYFDDSKAHLGVATGRSSALWLGVLIHEYEHMRQWRDGSPAWAATQVAEEVDAGTLLQLWLRGLVELEAEKVARYADLTMRVELECEKATARTLRSDLWGLGLDPVRYTQSANAYLFFHSIMVRDRLWIKPGTLNHLNTRLLEVCPDHFLPAEQYTRLGKWVGLEEQLLKCGVSLVDRDPDEL